MFEWYVVLVWLEEWVPKRRSFQEGSIACPKYDHHLRFDIQRKMGGGDLYDHLINEYEDVHFDDELDTHPRFQPSFWIS